jgi:F420-dependent oxidoreductase, CPS_4043 family
MDFGVVLQTNPPASGVIAMMQRAEEAGFSYGWTWDSHVLWQEPFVIYSRILAATSAMTVGPMVTNPGTRDWSVIASLFATLNDMYGNRTVCGIGRGDSARRVIGQPPMTLATLSEAMTVIKGLAEGREVTHHGQPLRIPWVRDGKLEIWMAAYGPKALKLTGEQADGFILQTADPDIARWTIGSVRAAAAAAGGTRLGEDLRGRARLRGHRPGAPAGAAEVVRRHGGQSRGRPGGQVRHGRAGPEGADRLHQGPGGLRLRAPRQGGQPDGGLRAGRDRGPVLPDRPGRRARGPAGELAGMGVDQFSVYLMHDQEEQTLAAYRDEVIPALR